MSHVAGFCVGNDVSERVFQLERGTQWTKGKSADTLKPLGPWLVTTDEVGDGVLIQIVKDKSKLRARVVSDGYDPNKNMRFPRSIRKEGVLFVVEEVKASNDDKYYIAYGKIRRLVQDDDDDNS